MTASSQIGGAFRAGDRFGPWHIQRRVGAGATATVYLATNPDVPGRWALKAIHPAIAGSADFQRRFARAAEVLAPVKHAGLPDIHSWGELDGRLYLVESFIDGVPLLDPNVCPVDWREVRSLMRGVTVIVAAIHQQQIIHRDIKPANLLVRADGSVVLIDLGLAKLRNDSEELGLTASGVGMGTLEYVPPEQILDAKRATERSDLYALGATFFHAAFGIPPFRSKTVGDLIREILHSAVKIPRDRRFPEGFDSLLSRMLQKRPEDRPVSAVEVLTLLDAMPPG